MSYAPGGKRTLDFLAAGVGLVLTLPVLGVIAILVKLSSPGPLFFRQPRVGRDGRVFDLIKFRTMHWDPSEQKKEFTPGNAGRVTGAGRILRETKLDELPELWNVLRGEMSLVGPRPEVPKYRPWIHDHFPKALKVHPGVTDYASLKYIEEEKILSRSFDPESTYLQEILPDKLRINAAYAENIRLGTDLRVLLLTLGRLLRKRNPSSRLNETGDNQNPPSKF